MLSLLLLLQITCAPANCDKEQALGVLRPPIISSLPTDAVPSDPVAGMSLWLDFGDPTKVYQDAALTTLAVADNDPVRGVADKSGNSRKMVMSGGYDPLLWRSVLRGCDAFRHDAVFPRLEASGWNASSVCNATSCTIFLIGQVPAATDSILMAGEGYWGVAYSPPGPSAIAGIWNGGSTDNAVLSPVVVDASTHLVMMRLSPGFISVGMDDVHDASLVTVATTGADATAMLQPFTTSYGVAPYTARYQTLLIYKSSLTEANALLVASWARGRWGIP